GVACGLRDVSRRSRIGPLASLRFPLDAVDVGAGCGVDDDVRLCCPQRVHRVVAFSQVNGDVDTGIRSKTERDDRRPKSPHRGDEQSAKLTASASHEYALPRQLAYPLRRRRHVNGRPAAGGSLVGAVGIVPRRLRGQ
ncbi:MAG: hypothetical protein K0S83_107, partial [Thermomicrobiales bacterium]|nr:hypothetical protein [Thermomicrobiales bacterium]